MNCGLFGIFYCLALNHLARAFYLFFHNGCLWRRVDAAFFTLNIFFLLQITGVYHNITSPVTGKSTDLAFKFGKILSINPFSIYIKNL